MSVLKNLIKVKNFCYFKWKYLRFISTNDEAILKKNSEVILRKYLKPLSNQVLKPPTGNFVCNLFEDTIDKRIFEYPAVLREEDVDVILNQSSKVEDYFSSNTKSVLTEETLQKLKELELFGLSVPQKYGGAGYSETESTFLIECTGVNSTLGRFISYNEICCKLLSRYGSEEQKEKYLPRLAEGKSFMTLACLENGPLVDPSKIEGFATVMEEKNGYMLNGVKKWVHNADQADLFLVKLKSPQIIDENNIRLKFNMFIVEKNTPGVAVRKLILPKAQKTNIFEVSLKDVFLAQKNLLGEADINGFTVLKTGLSHSNIGGAALCLNLLKQILHATVQFIQDNNLNDTSVKGYGIIQDNLASIVMHVYALESVIYFLTGRFDSYENFNLFEESILVKVIAIESLQLGIQKYIEIAGRESLKKSGILEEAIEAVQYYSVFDENIEYLKVKLFECDTLFNPDKPETNFLKILKKVTLFSLFDKMVIGADGLISVAPKLNHIVNTIRRPYDYPSEFFKNSFQLRNKNIKRNDFKMELHSSLSEAADTIEKSCDNIKNGIKGLFVDYGSIALEKEHIVIKLVEKVAYVYAAIACLSRSSFSICYDLENYQSEQMLAQAFAHFADSKIEQLFSEETKYIRISEYYRFIGKNTFNNKGYPAEHPLSRTY